MSVLCCQIPAFLLQLVQRHQPALAGQPAALLGPDESVWAVSPEAKAAGIACQMRPRQAQTRCPDIIFHALDEKDCRMHHAAFLDILTAWELPVEEITWGHAYIDLHPLSDQRHEVQPLAADLGQRLRQTLGTDLLPKLGWDHGKFTARAAAASTKPGRMRLVDRADEVAFLKPLPISLLPLEANAVQYLGWLGIRTLGQFARLPRSAVRQHLGKAGLLAQQWAKGQDDRPVRATTKVRNEAMPVPLESSTGLIQTVIDGLITTLDPHLARMNQRLNGVQRIEVTLGFLDGQERRLDVHFMEPAQETNRIRVAFTQQLQQLNWPDEVDTITITRLQFGELAAQQLTLFGDWDEREDAYPDYLARMAARYGSVFLRGQIVQTQHPLLERRFVCTALP